MNNVNEVVQLELAQSWRMQGFDPGTAPAECSRLAFDDRFWMAAEVPGDVHSTLIKRGSFLRHTMGIMISPPGG